jgi:hypothetical protein
MFYFILFLFVKAKPETEKYYLWRAKIEILPAAPDEIK